MAEVNVDTRQGEPESAFVEGPFDKGKEVLESKGYRIISLEENARLRIQGGKDADIARHGNWTREGVIYAPKKGIFLTKNSPIMANVKEAIDRHRNGNEFYLTDSQVEKALEDSVELKKENIPTNRFKDNKIAVYAFGNYADEYGRFLEDAGIEEMPVWLVNMQKKSFARQMWFRNLYAGSTFNGDNWDLYLGSYRMRGVRESSEDATKNSETYSTKQITDALKDLGFSALEKELVGKLRQ